jgi:hypothetical protein
MQLDWGLWKARAGTWMTRARNGAGAAALAALAFLLAAQAAGARRERESVLRESAAMDREIDRLRRANQSMRDEARALESDPVYVEALLRRWKMIGPSERIVE